MKSAEGDQLAKGRCIIVGVLLVVCTDCSFVLLFFPDRIPYVVFHVLQLLVGPLLLAYALVLLRHLFHVRWGFHGCDTIVSVAVGLHLLL